MKNQWFEASKDGLAKTQSERPKSFILFEMIANGFDTNAKNVTVSLTPVAGRPLATLIVEDDDPDGFSNLADSFTIFGESTRKADAQKSGRWGLGEKLVIAMCEEATLWSTKGTVVFHASGERTESAKGKRTYGSRFEATIRLTREEAAASLKEAKRVIVPEGVTLTVNGEDLPHRKPIQTFEVSLPTVLADDEGHLRRTVRKTKVSVYEPLPDFPAAIYELGIPVVEAGDRYDIDVRQKVPLGPSRDAVSPGYLRELRALVLDATKHMLTPTIAREAWVTDALQQADLPAPAVIAALEQRFEKPIDKISIFDPRDQEANHTLVSEGFAVVAGGSLPKAAWENVKRTEAIKPSGQIRPTPKPYSDDPEAPVTKIVPREKWTADMVWVVNLAKILAKEFLYIPGGVSLAVNIVEAGTNFAACYTSSRNGGLRRWREGEEKIYGGKTAVLDLNLTTLGAGWFSGPLCAADVWAALDDQDHSILALLLHEFAHEVADSHLDHLFHETVTSLGARLAVYVASNPHVLQGRPSSGGAVT